MAILFNPETGTIRYSNETTTMLNKKRTHERIRSMGRGIYHNILTTTESPMTTTTTTSGPPLNSTEWTWTDGEVQANEYTYEQPPREVYPIYVGEGEYYTSGHWTWRENTVIYDDLEGNQSRWQAIGAVGEYVEYASDYERGIFDQGYGGYATGHFFSRIIV